MSVRRKRNDVGSSSRRSAKKQKSKNEDLKGEIILYKNNLEVRLVNDTVWLSQKQISDLLSTERSVVTKHIKNIFSTNELSEKSVCAKFAHTAEDGKVYQTRFYNLDLIISIGYRVNSKRGTQFRIWATEVLKKHLIDGYTLNQKRLAAQTQKIIDLQQAVKLLGNVTEIQGAEIDK